MEVGTQCLPNRFQCKKAKVSFALPFRVVWFLLVCFFIAGLLLHLECVFHWELNASRLGDRPSHSISALKSLLTDYGRNREPTKTPILATLESCSAGSSGSCWIAWA